MTVYFFWSLIQEWAVPIIYRTGLFVVGGAHPATVLIRTTTNLTVNLEDQIAQIINPQEFTRLCNAILTAEYGADFQVIDGTRSDEGNDGYLISEKRIIAMYCPIKPERK
jgi:hypothetical protein